MDRAAIGGLRNAGRLRQETMRAIERDPRQKQRAPVAQVPRARSLRFSMKPRLGAGLRQAV